MNIYYNKIWFIKIWKRWKQLYNAFVKLYRIIMEGVFGVHIHKGQMHFLAIPMQMWISILKSLAASRFQSFIIVYLLLLNTSIKKLPVDASVKYPNTCPSSLSSFHPTFGLQRTGTYDYAHPLHGVTPETLNRNCLPWGRTPNKMHDSCCYEKVFWKGRQGKPANKLFRHYINLNNELRSAHYY